MAPFWNLREPWPGREQAHSSDWSRWPRWRAPPSLLVMSAGNRAAFRATLGAHAATWTRGRGWALATGLNAYTSYAAANPRVAAQTTRQITEALIGGSTELRTCGFVENALSPFRAQIR